VHERRPDQHGRRGDERPQAWSRARLVEKGIVKPTEDEKQQLAAAQQQQQQPDPQAEATVQALRATADKEAALAEKAKADTEQSKAKTVQILAEAHTAHADLGHAATEHKVGVLERMRNMFAPKPV
jgi:hypothetical protein